jgi:hypothetical protein
MQPVDGFSNAGKIALFPLRGKSSLDVIDTAPLLGLVLAWWAVQGLNL